MTLVIWAYRYTHAISLSCRRSCSVLGARRLQVGSGHVHVFLMSMLSHVLSTQVAQLGRHA